MLYFLQQSTSVKIGRKSVKNAVFFTAFISIKSGRNVDDSYRKKSDEIRLYDNKKADERWLLFTFYAAHGIIIVVSIALIYESRLGAFLLPIVGG